MERYQVVDFGGWVKAIIDQSPEVTVSDLSRETGIPYPSLDRILNSGKKGKVVRPSEDTIEAVSQALVKLKLIGDAKEAWVAAGFLVDGYQIKKADVLPEVGQQHDAPSKGEFSTRFEHIASFYEGAPLEVQKQLEAVVEIGLAMVKGRLEDHNDAALALLEEDERAENEQRETKNEQGNSVAAAETSNR